MFSFAYMIGCTRMGYCWAPKNFYSTKENFKPARVTDPDQTQRCCRSYGSDVVLDDQDTLIKK